MKDYSFGNYICALRTGLGLSQFQLGTLVGVTDKAVSKWENGDAKPRLATCYRLAEVLGVGINELLSCEQYITIPARKELDKMNQKLWKEAYERLSIYGDNPPPICWSRLAAEEAVLQGTDAIQAFAILGKMKQEALSHNTTIIVAGTIGASFAAWLLGATEVNPLPPHYICSECGNVEFVPDTSDGFDLPPKKCRCGQEFMRDGHNIPYEGYANAARGGTYIEIRISDNFRPVAVKILLDFYNGVAEVLPVMVHGDDDSWCMERYVVLPEQKTKPVLADDGFWHIGSEEYWKWQEGETTFSFLSSDQLNVIEKLKEATGVYVPNLWDLITPQMADALYQRRHGKLNFITKALTGEPHDFELLMRLDLLSHSTGAWMGNGEELIQTGKAKFRELPAAREDIFNLISNSLVKNGIRDNGLALLVMERTRKGLFCSRGMSEDIEKLLLSLGLPEWYPDYLKKVKYLFPKAHSVEFLLVDLIDEWYHTQYPQIYKKVYAENVGN